MEDKYIGKRLDGRYEIHELIGVGGMAYVYKAFDKETQAWVAIKILKEEFANNSDFLRRFRNESRAIAMLSHDNIVKVFDVSFGDKIQYIVMEYISGITLKDYIMRKGALAWKDTVFFTMQILLALEHAHQSGIIHRDIKPQNIILLRDGKIKVADFGIARFSQSETQTMTDKAMGSVHYIAPEQAKGEYTSDKADIYSLGVMMYEMLTGQLPFEAENAVSVAIMQLQAEAQRPRLIKPDIPVALEEITLKAMEKSPAMRFRSANEMLEDFEKFRKNPNIEFNYESGDKMHTQSIAYVQEPISKSKSTSYMDNYEYEEELVRSKKLATSSMVITGVISAIVLIALIFGAMALMDFLKEKPDEQITDEILVPVFVGLNYENDIANSTKYDDFEFKVFYVDSIEEPGIIVRQDPASQIKVKKGKEIELYISKSPESAEDVVIPDIAGESQAEAYNIIRDAGFIPRIEAINSDVTANFAIKSEPVAGTEHKSGSEVTIYVSKGPKNEQITIPVLTGLELDTALKVIEDAGLEIGEIKYDDESELPKDEVIEVSPEEDKKVSKGTKVDLVVSSGLKTERTIAVSFDLPSFVQRDVNLKLYVGGELKDDIIVNPSLNPKYIADITGVNGKVAIVILLDDANYVNATADFDLPDPTVVVDFVGSINP